MAGKQSKAQKAQAKRSEAARKRSELLKVQSNAKSRKERVEKEESSFSKLTSHQLEQFNLSAHYSVLKRPVPPSFAVFQGMDILSSVRSKSNDSTHDLEKVKDESMDEQLSLPKKPRWKNVNDAKSLHSNEREVFRQWLEKTDEKLFKVFSSTSRSLKETESSTKQDKIPNQIGYSVQSILEIGPEKAIIPTLYERNLEVYRQLWRVVERSDIIAVLMDVRCPLLHLPHSLKEYLMRFARLKTILVLTKCDLVHEAIVKSWKEYLQTHNPTWKVVETESYLRKERLEGQGSRIRQAPFISPESKSSFFQAVKDCHQELITPPRAVASDPKRLKDWKPPCITKVDWKQVELEGVEKREGFRDEKDEETMYRDRDETDGKDGEWKIPDYLTIGLVGQPNVGKSSLLNALVGSKVVRASKTAGKTKHFQTHHLSKQVRLCDCPGLVFPSLIGSEMQVLGNILPISQVQAISSVVRFVGSRLELEKVLNLTKEDMVTDDSILSKDEEFNKGWTALKILEALAKRYNYKTAKANRYDTNRAGNGLIRALAEGRIRWAFRPPPTIPGKDQSADAGLNGEIEESEKQLGFVGDDYCDQLVKESGIWLGDIHQLEGRDGDQVKDSLMEDHDDDDNDEEEEVLEKQAQGETNKGLVDDEEAKGRLENGSGEDDDDEEDEESEQEEAGPIKIATSMFAALGNEEGESEDEESDEESS